MISATGWTKYCIWEHSSIVRDLYARRCRLEAEEMTCAAQAAELLAPHVRVGDTLLDVGCGSGYFFHSLRKRAIPVEYYGIDAAPTLIDIGRRYMPAFGLAADRLQSIRLEDLDADVDHVVCMNVLSNLDNFHRPLERLLASARRTVVLRESCKHQAEYRYVLDPYLDDGHALNVHVNAYDLREWTDFICARGFDVTTVVDRRTNGEPELVVDQPHYWKFFVAIRRQSS